MRLSSAILLASLIAILVSSGDLRAEATADRPTLTEAADFVAHHGAPAQSGQLARWTEGVCIETTGVPADISSYVDHRIRDVAIAVGAPAAKGERCTTNVEVIFTNAPQLVLDKIAHSQSVLLGYHNPGQLKAAERVSRPIQAWYLTATENDRGDRSLDVPKNATENDSTARLTYDNAPGGYTANNVSIEASASRMQLGSQMPVGCLQGKFSRCLHSVLVHVLIVVDGKTLYGRQIGPLVDYVALLSLSEPAAFNACDSMASVLDLLSTNCSARPAPQAITSADLAYLSALYKTNLEVEISLERADISNTMTRVSAPSPPRQ